MFSPFGLPGKPQQSASLPLKMYFLFLLTGTTFNCHYNKKIEIEECHELIAF